MARRNVQFLEFAIAHVLVVALAPGPLWAQTPKLVPSAPVPAPAPQTRLVVMSVGLDAMAKTANGRLDHAAEDMASKSGRFSLVRLVDALDATNFELRQVRLKSAEAKWAAGLQAYEELDTKRAADDFNESLKAFKQTDFTQQFPAFIRTFVMRAAALLANGETRAAEVEMEKILALDGRAVFSSDYFAPDALRRAEELRRVIANKASFGMQVNTVPRGARIYVDGQFRGVSPLKLTQLPSGEHWLTVVAPGYELLQQAAVPGVNELNLRPAESQPRWQGVEERILKDARGPDRDAAAMALCQWVKADQVLLTLSQASPGGNQLELTALRADCKDGHNAAYAQKTVSSGDVASKELEAFYSQLMVNETPRDKGIVTHFVQASLGAKKAWAYILLGTAAAMVAGGAVMGSLSLSRNSEFRSTPLTDAASARLKETGQTYALTADLLFLGALLTGAPGALLMVDSNKPPAPPPTAPLSARTP